MKLFTRTFLLLLLLLLISFSGCIKEDMDDCPTGVKIYFDYTPVTYARTGVDPSEVKRIDVFVFDAQGIFKGVWIDKNPVLSKDYFITVTDLPKNQSYRFIAWTGLETDYFTTPAAFVNDETTFDEVRFSLEHQSGTIGTLITPLFHAEKSHYIDNNREQRVNIPLVQVYNTVNLTTEGLSNNLNSYRMTINDNNGNYKFDCSFAPDSDFNYTTLCKKDDKGQLSARLDVLKLASNRSPIIEIADQNGNMIFSENLVELINALGNNNYDYTHTYDIHIKFGLSVSVSLNGWWVVEDGNIILK
ncbi:FimB/Mfa2 family fimbrial subunit [Massilibacteroides vaginae]|uniref:FimB/Mfa2 family fimbrial subunit n=1 Tax=Massilibacteroides vaginae TaxID=1673718 RepID=UPI000A1C966A|nr:FimB/Mfa2 family fimbrial subunit [Massilibacteroides vaginae]